MSMEDILRAKLLAASGVPVSTTVQGMASTASAIQNINAPETMQAAMAKAHLLRNQKKYLPAKPQEGETVFQSTFGVNNFHMPDGRIVEVRQHFCSVFSEEDKKELEDIARLTRTLSVYEGPWADDESSEL